MENTKKNLLIGLSGSVASTLVTSIISAFTELYNLRMIITSHAKIFTDQFISDYSEFERDYHVKVYLEDDEWTDWFDNQKVLHIELRKWADICLIAPLSANTMAKIAVGLCDNLLTNVIRAWDFSKPVVYALAMNTNMYTHVLTAQHRKILSEEFKFIEVPVTSKLLASGDVGIGALADIESIVEVVEAATKDMHK